MSNLWTDIVDERTGRHSLTEHELKLVKTWCAYPEHVFIEIDNPKRLLKCTKCGQEITYIVGKQKLVDGKLIEQ